MRHENLTGFALHQRKYRERSYILHFFSEKFGRVDGVIRQVPPSLYHYASLQANGKSELKNFSQLDVQGQPFYLQHRALFAGFYLNEVLLRLLPLEEPMPETYQAYQDVLTSLKILPIQDTGDQTLKLILRQFETIFLNELGYQLDYTQDAIGQEIVPHLRYQFIPKEGFVISTSLQAFLGQDLLKLAEDEQIHSENMTLVGKLYRTLFNDLLGNKPLKSRQLWISQQQRT